MNNNIKALQKRANRFKWIAIILVIVLYLPIAYFISERFNIPNRVMRYAALPLFLVGYNMYTSRKRDFILAFNETVTSRIVNTLRPNWNHQAEAGIEEDVITETYLIQKRPYTYTSNLMTGAIGNVDFRFCHVETSKSQNLAGRLPKVEFKGYFFEFDFPKYTREPIHVHPPAMKDYGDILKIPPKKETDSAEFNKAFRTYCDDPVEMRYLLSLGLMARMIDLQNVLPGSVSFCFQEGKVYVAIKIKGSSLEPHVGKKIDMEQITDTHRQAFDLVEQFVEELKLQLELWDKEVS